MKKKFLSLFAIIAALAFGVPESKAQAKTAVENSGLLYEITGKDLKKPSYLFGTIHLICQKDMLPADVLKNYLDRTEQLIVEVDLNDTAAMQKAVAGMMLTNGKTLKDSLKAEEYAKLDEVFKTYMGVSFERFQTFKPVLLSTLLTTSPKSLGCQAVPGYDKVLMDTATAGKKPIVGLETVESQYAALDSQPFEKQIEGLNKVAADPEKSFENFRKVYQIYLAQNTDELYKLTAEQFKTEEMPLETLLDNRNKNWIPLLEKNLGEKSSFIAVGAGHLGGKNGVINLLRAKGYKLTPIKL